ncbi:hypothetical protein [Gordonia sp. DT101]|uniref:hypothetical protein n=1 Tax=Gordonia sp. DT101 TaxID=3416545 RepID=UPI003CEBEFDC
MRSSRAITVLIGACVTAVAAVLIAILPLAHAGAASTNGMGGGASSQSGNSKSGHNKATPSPGNRRGEAHKIKPRPAPSSPAAPKKPSTPHRSPAKPDRDPHKYSPKTKAPNTSDHGARSGNKRKGADRPSGPSENRGPNKSTPNTFARPDSSPDRSSHGRPGTSGRTEDRTPDRDDPPATPLDSPGMDGVDNDHDGIVDNENPFVELPPVEIPMPRGGGLPLPGMKPPAPKVPAEPAPAPAPKAPESAPARPAQPPAAQPPAAQKPAPAPAKLRPWQQGAPRPPQVPEGYVAGPARNGKGVVWRPPGSQGDENSIRIMEPTPQHPNGYVRYYNKYGQPVDQQMKPTGPDLTHHDLGPDGQFPSVPSGWPQK